MHKLSYCNVQADDFCFKLLLSPAIALDFYHPCGIFIQKTVGQNALPPA